MTEVARCTCDHEEDPVTGRRTLSRDPDCPIHRRTKTPETR